MLTAEWLKKRRLNWKDSRFRSFNLKTIARKVMRNYRDQVLTGILRKNLEARAADLLREHEQDLAGFFKSERGRQFPTFISKLSEHLEKERANITEEIESLRRNIGHINEIVAMQQAYARVSGEKQPTNIAELGEDSIRINAGSLSRHNVKIVREFNCDPVINVEKHKILQILVNLVRNAKYACDESGGKDKRLIMKITSTRERVRVSLVDNGVGISKENLGRIFTHGFTNRKHGHGFGLYGAGTGWLAHSA